MRRVSVRTDLAALLALTAALGIFFWKLLFTNLILARGDTFFYIYPYWSAAAEALRSGRLPLWNPHLFMGAPFLANSQAGTLYPFNWPLWLLLSTPIAAKVSIALHLLIAGVASYGFARQGLRLRPAAAWFAAFSFMLGGYLTAQVEHVNQVQGLAWLPAVFWLLARPRMRGRPWLLGAILGLQILAGHTQAVFITIVGGGIYAAWLSWPALRARLHGVAEDSLVTMPLSDLAIAGVVGFVLAAAQVFPTVELSGESIRGSGLPVREALSFSLHPLLVGRALLPGYGETLFTEYVAFVPLTGILMASIGLWGRWRHAMGLALVGAVGLFFALGATNPVYVLLVRLIPGFGLFRAPARWLALYAFGISCLAGMGFDVLLGNRPGARRRAVRTWAAVVIALVAWSWVAPHLTRFFPSPPESPVQEPTADTAVGWGIDVVVALVLVWPRRWSRVRGRAVLLTGASVAAVFVASRALPYNHPTAPEALSALRPAPAQLLAAAEFDDEKAPGRFLSMSDIFFDPGDMAELESIYGDQLDAEAFYDFLIATKQKEILTPNLPLYFGLWAVDGYDGGVLPLADYVTLERLLLPDDQVSMDGRLRENLDQIPDGRWLSLFNVRFLITDKVGDAWADGVFYDLQHGAVLDAGRPAAAAGYLPTFEATGMGVVLSYPDVDPDTPLVRLVVGFADGGEYETVLKARGSETLLRSGAGGQDLVVRRVDWPRPGLPVALSASVVGDPPLPVTIRGVSLVDRRDGTFQSVVLSSSGHYRLVHSGDVKIYENLDPLPRAFLVSGATWVEDDDAAVAHMKAPAFDPAAEVVLSGSGEPLIGAADQRSGSVSVVSSEAERVVLRVEGGSAGWLVLTDAFYPGWDATVDGERTDIVRADILFRALPVEPGSHEVVFSFRPLSVRLGLVVSVAAAALSLLSWFMVRRAR
jgi:hypothetical protein